MLTPSFKTTAIKQTKDYGEFALEPLEQGYGHTLGNSLRRVLLSSLEGADITEIKITGVKHQFTTLDGLQEDIVELILNLKKVRLSYSGEKESENLTLDIKGAKEVKASDIKTPATVTIHNPDLKLATLADKSSKLSIKMTVQKGQGFSPAEDRKSNSIGVIPIDAAFSPVVRVAYRVEQTRVGRRTDYDKLIMQVWTDGSVKPKATLLQAAEILVGFFRQVYKPTFKKEVKSEESELPQFNGEVYDLTVEELELPTRIANALRRGGYKTVRHIVEAKIEDLTKVKNLGDKSIQKVKKALAKKDVELKGV